MTLVVEAKAHGGGVNEGETGEVRFVLRAGRKPTSYYGLAVSRLNRVFDWGRPWRVTGHHFTN